MQVRQNGKRVRASHSVIHVVVQEAEGARDPVALLFGQVTEIYSIFIQPCGSSCLEAAEFESRSTQGGRQSYGRRFVQSASGKTAKPFSDYVKTVIRRR
jgi:hypothetical protein